MLNSIGAIDSLRTGKVVGMYRIKRLLKWVIDMLNKSIVAVAIGVVVFCCWFFDHAFGTTIQARSFDVPTVNVFAGTNVNAKVVETVLCGERYQNQLRSVLESREAIVKMEHDNFRAELGTWLSIFGLLSILATISVTAFSYVCQQASLKSEKEEIKKTLETEKEEIKKKFTELEKRLSKLKVDFENEFKTNLENEFKAKQDEVGNVGAVAVTEIRESALESPVESSEAWGDELESVQDESRMFIKMWAQKPSKVTGGPFDEKIKKGIEVLKKFNELIKKYLTNAEAEIEILKKFNLLNIYLGQGTVKSSKFFCAFVQELREEKPLKVPYDNVKECLRDYDNGYLIAGYYGHVYKLQEKENFDAWE